MTEPLGALLGRAHVAHREVAEAGLRSLGLTPKGFGALAVLDATGPLSQQRLAERQGIDRTTMVAVVDDLERSDLVVRRRDPSDRRAYALHLTASGRSVLARARTVVRDAEDEFLAPLSSAERARFILSLRRLLGL